MCTATAFPKMPRLGMIRKSVSADDYEVPLPPEFATYYYTQTLDHFNYRTESYITFQQRYIINSKYWGGPNTSSPIFVYTGDEAIITAIAAYAGFIVKLASYFNGLLLYIESVPFGSKQEAFQNTSNLGFFSSTQALANYAQLITDVKKNLSAEHCPVIAVGGSYGGMLSSWFRLKYPHVAFGALASSAPILYFDDITPEDGYHAIVTKDFRETSKSCYNTIRKSWSEIDEVAAESNGLYNLSQTFRTCQPLNSSEELKDFLAFTYVLSAQYDDPQHKPVEKLCNAIDGAAGSSALDRVAAGLNARSAAPCHYMISNQTCAEMEMPIGCEANDTMFEATPFDLNNYTRECEELFGVTPRPHWITTEFGATLFSNGLRDPYSAGGVVENISDSVVAVYTQKGSHTLDMVTPTMSDPDWLVSQRDTEMIIIEGWIADYNAKLPFSS
ncbi:Lysosomal Pro-Xaa carboxypeptidase [Bertholletia excelsa]